MRILTLCAFFPPYAYGGYELRVSQVMAELAQRGHEVRVLTTLPDKGQSQTLTQTPYPVIRCLHHAGRKLGWAEKLTFHPSANRLGVSFIFLRQQWRDALDLNFIDKQLSQFKPDLIYLGHIAPLTASLMPFLAHKDVPLVADEGGLSLVRAFRERSLWYRFQSEFQPNSPILSGLKRMFIRCIGFASRHRISEDWAWPARLTAIFNGKLNLHNAQAAAVPLLRAEVIHSGLDLDRFSLAERTTLGAPLSVFLPGRIEPDKGQLDALALVHGLRQVNIDCKLTIAGDPWKPEFLQQLRNETKRMNLEKQVQILPLQDTETMITLYQNSDICFFPSYHQTGFSRVPLEAMACGSLLVAYGREGSDEIIQHGSNGILTEPGNMPEIISIIQELRSDPSRYLSIVQKGRQWMEAQHSFSGYVDQIERLLRAVGEGSDKCMSL